MRSLQSFWVNILYNLLPPANEVWGKVIFLHLSVILFTGGSTWAGNPHEQIHPLPGIPLSGQVHPLTGTLPWAGTPHWQVHPPGRYTPDTGQVHPPQVHPRNACWDTVNKLAVRILLECILYLFLQEQEEGCPTLLLLTK